MALVTDDNVLLSGIKWLTFITRGGVAMRAVNVYGSGPGSIAFVLQDAAGTTRTYHSENAGRVYGSPDIEDKNDIVSVYRGAV